LLALLVWMKDKATPEEVVNLSCRVEELLARLGRPEALAQATRTRQQAARKLGGWSRDRFLAERASIDRLLERVINFEPSILRRA
jgi:hypothetical protein